jgi:hypothetical protein
MLAGMRPTILRAALLLSSIGAPSAAEACTDYASDPTGLVALESDAGRGALSQQSIDCLEASYASADVATTKSKISRVLLVNAYAYSTSYWAKLVARHLNEVEQSDPDIAYLYAFYLFNHDADLEEVIRWTDVALERRTAWAGDVLVSRVYQMQRTRALAAYRVWQRATENGAPDEQVETQRNRAKTYARDWLDYARSAGRDTAEAEEVCISAASRAACGLD